MRYDKAKVGSRPSASQWNGFLDLHRRVYAGSANNGPVPPLLDKSVIASASLDSSSADIGPYSPVRIIKQINFDGSTMAMPTYLVEAVDTAGGERHGNYGFSLGEGVTDGGGRIVVSGIAIAQVASDKLVTNRDGEDYDGAFDAQYYSINDGTLSDDPYVIAPAGHYRVISWYDTADVPTGNVYVAIDMSKHSTSFMVELIEDIDAAVETAGVTLMDSVMAYVKYGALISDTGDDAYELSTKQSDEAYRVRVYNPYERRAPMGDALVSYSAELNRFVIATQPQTNMIGKALADITVGSTGTIEIWRDGSNTQTTEEAKLDWMAGADQVSLGKEVMITWFGDEGIWRITGAECED